MVKAVWTRTGLVEKSIPSETDALAEEDVEDVDDEEDLLKDSFYDEQKDRPHVVYFSPAHAVVLFCWFISFRGGLHGKYIENIRRGGGGLRSRQLSGYGFRGRHLCRLDQCQNGNQRQNSTYRRLSSVEN